MVVFLLISICQFQWREILLIWSAHLLENEKQRNQKLKLHLFFFLLSLSDFPLNLSDATMLDSTSKATSCI
jgi:hypothetical protein